MDNTDGRTITSDASGVSTEPYNPLDKVETNTMKFERQSGNGDRYYERPAQIDSAADADRIIGTDSEHFRLVEKQDYFYRAMHRDEYDAWQTLFKQTTPELRAKKYVELRALQINGHQGWASHRQYSEEYLSEKNGYTHLLEVHAPGFVSDMRSIGYKSGKAESGDLSWGLGLASSNSFGPDKSANKMLNKTYEDAKTKGLLLLPSGKKAQPKEMAKLLAPYFFCKDMKSMKTVNIRSTQDKPKAG
ncbi:hypothetical protein P3T24_000577 [Paraburkholderia sp. GAS33]|jgi:hypothetical protein|uniref:hypothetical protein n=1 Tax=Paraburkholderia sp. GAS33 TaxID=3035130 RepID=UPI003D1BB357